MTVAQLSQTADARGASRLGSVLRAKERAGRESDPER